MLYRLRDMRRSLTIYNNNTGITSNKRYWKYMKQKTYMSLMLRTYTCFCLILIILFQRAIPKSPIGDLSTLLVYVSVCSCVTKCRYCINSCISQPHHQALLFITSCCQNRSQSQSATPSLESSRVLPRRFSENLFSSCWDVQKTCFLVSIMSLSYEGRRASRSHALQLTHPCSYQGPTGINTCLSPSLEGRSSESDRDKQTRFRQAIKQTVVSDNELYSLDSRIFQREIIPVILHISHTVLLLKD